MHLDASLGNITANNPLPQEFSNNDSVEHSLIRDEAVDGDTINITSSNTSALPHQDENRPSVNEPSFNRVHHIRAEILPMNPGIDSPDSSPPQLEYDPLCPPSEQSYDFPIISTSNSRGTQTSDSPNLGSSPGPRETSGTDSSGTYKVSWQDTVWKILPLALKKYNIKGDWENYAMFICYNSTGSGNRIEQSLSYDEKPLLIYQKLKDTNRKPVFRLRKLEDIRSPMVVAQQEHAEDNVHGEEVSGSAQQQFFASGPDMSDSTHVANSDGSVETAWASFSEVSYALAFHPYVPEQKDEIDLIVGDTVIILSRARGWWVVQRDPSGLGDIGTGIAQKGWVPAGCLLETSVPVASAIAEAVASEANGFGSSRSGSAGLPILPSRIISTSFPGIALKTYRKKVEGELEIEKDDALRVFKRYNHWSYAVKEKDGYRGWVPSCFIGKPGLGVGTHGPPSF
ncbi:hypothetical protein C8R44DRAFT_868922 [Mycena epipterygia]|nr:hypothetical protein C8R44DRAFT_868922 [Mycena epipterygia]